MPRESPLRDFFEGKANGCAHNQCDIYESPGTSVCKVLLRCICYFQSFRCNADRQVEH